ncbi:MAG: stage III sporulation protein AG [Eubacteriales bacterium]|nr:stage III sporulation protein AG [Eubacteriales bacterium]
MVIALPVKNKERESSSTQDTPEVDGSSISYDMYESYVETKLENILSKVSGVGKTKVMVNLKCTNQKFLATDNSYSNNSEIEKQGSEDVSDTSEIESISTHIYYDTQDGSKPYIVMENLPVIEGVIVVCEGGDNQELVSDIITAVNGLLNVPVHKIKVMKMSN